MNQSNSNSRFSASSGVVACGTVLLIVYGLLLVLSRSFVQEVPQLERPLFFILGLFATSFFAYLIAIWLALRCRASIWRWIVGFAIAFRLTLLFSEPIQEVDIYRYIWDGLVTAEGVSPFTYPPKLVAEGDLSSDLPSRLGTLVELRDEAEGIHETLNRVHYPEVPTVYPPVSQAVFLAAAWVTPRQASVQTRVVVMKAILLIFDVATLALILLTLRHANLHLGWSAAYAWCPLVLKEFANSGHLDSIAVCFTTAAVYCALRGLFAVKQFSPSIGWLIGGAVLLGLAVGAKLYPVALVPILTWSALRKAGWVKTIVVASAFVVTCRVVLFPMFRTDHAVAQVRLPSDAIEQTMDVADGSPKTQDPQAGLKTFLSHWMMNDFIFLNVCENLTPDRLRSGPTPWFVVIPDSVRTSFGNWFSKTFEVQPERVAFVLARTITALIFVVLSGYFAGRASQLASPERWLELVFLSMAWFWLLLPTLNPWYWIWALPWIPFARNRVWLLLSGLLFIYYSRFYFEVQTEFQVGQYAGAAIFDFIVVWFEYVPWFIALCGWRLWQNQSEVANVSR